ncbi:GAF domain-containing protein, partial [Acinetobacter baumannii]
TLQIVVCQVKKAIGTQSCTVFLFDNQTKRYVLMATDGLNNRAVKKVHLGEHEGLVGLIGHRQEPINIEDAKSHPHFIH